MDTRTNDAYVFTPSNAGEFSAAVIANTQLSRRYYLLRLARPGGLVEPRAGQFVHVSVPSPPSTGAGERFFLRRPFSIHDCTRDFLDLVIVEVGPGSQALRRVRAGDTVDFYGPLGHSYPVMPEKRILAIGGATVADQSCCQVACCREDKTIAASPKLQNTLAERNAGAKCQNNKLARTATVAVRPSLSGRRS